ncbi:zf-DHHC-domain-containing protein [Xylariaceae sp. FL0016]|nr:zf-DHHC-domain-containing protein [Xylariaceae sp. FL0016]
MAFLVGATAPGLQRLAVPAVCLLIAFLGYGSQYLFAHASDLEPGPLTSTESYVFNTFLLCLWWTYYNAVTVDPGRYEFPSRKKTDAGTVAKRGSTTRDRDGDGQDESDEGMEPDTPVFRRRWCKKCAAPKPPRSHHCRVCRRCIPRMDHHCPWTSNCVSLQTFPHFLRFLLYTNVSLWALLYLLWQRFLALWTHRHLPSYLGPTLSQLVWLTVFAFAGGMTALMLFIMLVTTLKGWALNTTMIESWEIERHEAVLARSRTIGDDGTWWEGSPTSDDKYNNAPTSMLDPIEFPYDVGFFANMAQAMGTANPLIWLIPFAGNPVIARPSPDDIDSTTGLPTRGTGWHYDENDLNDHPNQWPPPDPDKIRHARLWRQRRREMDMEMEGEALYASRAAAHLSPEQQKAAFRQRQERDLRRWEGTRARILGELEEVQDYDGEPERDDYDFVDEAYPDQRQDQQRAYGGGYPRYRPGARIVIDEGKSGWVNAEGEKLGDFGVDEDAEFDDPAMGDLVDLDKHQRVQEQESEDDDVPLGELIRRRKVRMTDGGDT